MDSTEGGPAEVVFLVATQETCQRNCWCHDPLCPLHINHSVVWFSHKAIQGQISTVNLVCREDHQC